ncbi:kinase-like protein [Agrocybe pediades]|nr:kinase-like protein [Agrocybe pediades]
MKKPLTSDATGSSPAVEPEHDCCLRVQKAAAGDKSSQPFFWGSLQDMINSGISVDFYLSKANLSCTVGLATQFSTVYLPVFGSPISPCHCTISWDGESADSVTLKNNSAEDSLKVNGEPIGRGRLHPLRNGDMICFVSPKGAHTTSDTPEEYLFMYHHRNTNSPSFNKFYFADGLKLGSGAQGSVKKVVKRTTDQIYAVKTVVLTHKDVLHRSVKEIEIMRKLSHPGLCQLYECFVEQDRFMLVMDYMNGGDLCSYLFKEGPLAESPAKDIMFQLFSAVTYIHSLGVVHGDLKPENILLTRDEPVKVKICDFGLSEIACSHKRLMASNHMLLDLHVFV